MPTRQQRFVRLNSLGDGYAEEDIRAVIAGEKKHRSRIKSPLAKENLSQPCFISFLFHRVRLLNVSLIFPDVTYYI